MTDFDVVIIGAGTMGTAAAYHLARRGLRLLALEQFSVVHDYGSHSGRTRIIRHAYHESPDYVPLVVRSDQLWQELEKETNQQLLIRTGALVMGPRGCRAVDGALAACEAYSLPCDILNASQIQARWSQFNVAEDWQGCFDPAAGFLLVPECLKAHANRAVSYGAEISENENVISIQNARPRIEITTDRRKIKAEKVIVTAGAWTAKLLHALHLPLQIKRKTLFWLRTENPADYSIGRFPIFLADIPDGLLYGFPIYDSPGLKIANHSSAGVPIDPDHVQREVQAADSIDILNFARDVLPGVSQEIIESKVCLYNLTPDEDFIIDFHPENQNILLATGFSGHGFKFAPVVGEILADLITQNQAKQSIDRFRLSRFV